MLEITKEDIKRDIDRLNDQQLKQIGQLDFEAIARLESVVLFTLGYTN